MLDKVDRNTDENAALRAALVESEEQLRRLSESESLYRLLAENTSDLISRHKPSGEWLYLSPAAKGFLGFEPEELVGRDPFELIHPDDRGLAQAALASLMQTGQVQLATFRIRRADGKYIWSETTGRAVLDPQTGGLLEVVATSRDVTQRIETVQTLRQREAELAHAGRLSTMGQMASQLAHEMNQPLYAIANFADACLTLLSRQTEPVDPQLRGWLEQIAQQARRAGTVVRRISQFVRKGELHPQSLDLNAAIEGALAMLDIELRRHSIDVELDLAEALPQVEADRLLIEQVLVNLLRNAIDAMAAEDITQRKLVVRSRVRTGGVEIGISDSGPGLTESQIARAFEPFFTTKTSGTGMGLAICRSTIEAHDGRIWAGNHLLGGATFKFFLPTTEMKPSPPA